MKTEQQQNTGASHTPGPWKVSGAFVMAGDSNRSIARIQGDNYPRTQWANADMIAAAPEMLDALEELCRDKYLSDPINEGRMAKARKAIAKATGKGGA